MEGQRWFRRPWAPWRHHWSQEVPPIVRLWLRSPSIRVLLVPLTSAPLSWFAMETDDRLILGHQDGLTYTNVGRSRPPAETSASVTLGDVLQGPRCARVADATIRTP